MYNPVFIDSDKIDWQPTKTEGIQYKELRYNPQTKAGAILLKMDPNTTYPCTCTPRERSSLFWMANF